MAGYFILSTRKGDYRALAFQGSQVYACHAQLSGQQRLIQKAVGYAGLFQRAGQCFSVAGAGIHIVFAQGGGHLIHIHQTVQGAELGNAGIGGVGEDALGLGADLHRHAAVHQIGQGADIAVGADGLIIEVHNDPARAKSDGAQSLTPDQFDDLMATIRPELEFFGKTLN